MTSIPQDSAELGVRFVALSLRKIAVEPLGKTPEQASGQFEARFELNVSRPEADRLGVELRVVVDHPEVLRAEAAYGGLFDISRAALGDDDLRQFASRVAPSILYPFVREVLASMVHRTGLPPLVLPVLNFANVFDPSSVAVPPVPAEGSEPAADDGGGAT